MLGMRQGSAIYSQRQTKLIVWGPQLSYDIAMAEFMMLGAHVWDYRADILDGEMIENFAKYCLLHPTPCLFDPDEPAILEGPQRRGHKRQ
jgi:hypothetical protein